MPYDNVPSTPTPDGSHKKRAVSSTGSTDGGAGGRPAGTPPPPKGSAIGTPDIELTLTGDQDTDFQNIANAYKPRDMDADMWNGMWKSVLSAESGGNLNQGEAEYGRDAAGAGIRATGPMQVKPATARGLGFKDEDFNSNPFVKFAAGVKNMRDDWDALGGRASSPSHRAAMVFAAYHAGRPNVIKNLDANGDGVPDVDDGKVNTRDYTLTKMQALQQYLDNISASRGGIPESDEPVLKTDEEVGAGTATQPNSNAIGADSATGQESQPFSSVIPRDPKADPANFDEYLNEQDRKLREELGLIAPENYPHKVMTKPVHVAFELKQGSQLTQQMVQDAVTNTLTGDPRSAEQFRKITGEDPGGFLDAEEGQAWLDRQIQNGLITINEIDGRTFVEANVPVQSYVVRRINAMAKGGAPEVQAETARMREEVTQEERRAAEIRYTDEANTLRKKADELDLAAETKALRELGGVKGGTLEVLRDVDPLRYFGADKPQETEEAKQLRAQADALEAELERRFPATAVDEISKGIKRTIANVAQNYRNLERNVKNIGEAVIYTNDKQYAKEMQKRDQQYRKAAASLQTMTPQTRSIAIPLLTAMTGQKIDVAGGAEAIGTAVAFDAPLYLAGGAVFGPSGLIYTTAIRSADKPLDEFVKDIAAGLIEIPVGKALTGVINKIGYRYGVHEAGEKLLGRIISEGGGEVGGDAVIDYVEGKKFDWQNAFRNFVAGGAFGITGGGKSDEGGTKINQQETVPIQPWSPMGVAIGENGVNRYQILLKQGDEVALVELPPEHPLVIKYAAQAEAGGIPFLAFSNDQFDQAMNEFKGTGAAKLPKMTAKQASDYLSIIGEKKDEQKDDGVLREPQLSEVGQVQTEDAEAVPGTTGDVQEVVEAREEKQVQGEGDEQRQPTEGTTVKRKVKYKGEEIELDEDLADQFDDNTRQVKETVRAAKSMSDKETSDSVSKSQGYAQTAFRKGLIEQQKQRDNEAAIQKAKLSPDEITTLSSAYNKLGVKSTTDASKIIQTAAKRFQKKLKGTQEERDGIEAQERLESLTSDEQRALSKVLPEAFAAPVKAAQPGVEGEEGTSRRIEAMTDEEFEKEPQLVANEREAGEFFDKAKKGEVDTATTAEEKAEGKEAAKQYKKEQTSIKGGTKKVKKGKVEITLPKKLAAEWEAADQKYEVDSRKVQNAKGLGVAEKTRKLSAIQKERKAARDRIFSQYQILEDQQTRRGYIRNSAKPVTIVDETADKYVIREPNSNETREILKEEVETAKERALRQEKTAKLPLRTRVKKALGGFEEDKERSQGKDGVVYVNETAKEAIEDAIGYAVEDGQTFSNENLPKVTKMLRDKGLNTIAKQLETQAKGRAGAAIVPVANEDAGKARFHEQIHTVAYDKELSNDAVEDLYRDGSNVRKLIDELSNSDNEGVRDVAELNPYDLIQEVLAYGLTGDFDTLEVSPDTLHDALVDVAEKYLREFPDETLANIAENALINFDKIAQEADARIKKEAKNETKQAAGKGDASASAKGAKKRGQREGEASPEKRESERAEAVSKVTKANKEEATKRRKASLAKMRRDTNPDFNPKTQLDVSEELEAVAKDYNKKAGRSEYNVDTYYNFKPEVYNKIADLMESLPHQPEHPDVVRMYKALAKETVDQYNHILEAGYTMEPWQQEGQPYADSKAMRRDVIENKHLYFFLGSDMDPAHPMAQSSGVKIGDYDASVNDVFRAVHDFFGHAVSGAQFGARGELNATDSHARMYSPEALPAMVGETVFQNAWVNYGPHIRRPDGSIPVKGDPDFFPPDKRPYAEQKAMNITPEHVQLWLSAYTETPRSFSLARKTAAAPAKKKKSTKLDPETARELDLINRKQSKDLTAEDVRRVIESGKFAVLSGNTSNLPGGTEAYGARKTENLKRELEKMGYKVLRADGVYAPTDAPANIEPSLFVVLQDELDVPNLIRLSMRYKQAQVLIGEGGEFRAPFTANVDSGRIGTENFGDKNTVLFDAEAEEQAGKTRVKIGGKDFSFSVPDTFDKTRKQTDKEVRFVKELTKAYKDSFKNRAQGSTASLYNLLKKYKSEGKRKELIKEDAAKALEKLTRAVMGAPPKKVERVKAKGKGAKTEGALSTATYDAIRTRRAVADAIAILKDRLFGQGDRTTDDETGLSWYAAAIKRMHEVTGEAFPEVLNVPQLRALFDLTLALSSQGNKVKDNFRYTVDLWMRLLTEFDLGREGTERVFPTKLKQSREYIFKGEKRVSENYGRFGAQLEKFNMLTQGYIPVPSKDQKKILANKKKYDLKKTQEFEDVNGAQQWYMKDPELEADLKKYGHIGGVFEYLLKPGKTPNNPYRSTEILGPKIGAFFLNIAGFSQLVTVDMWASRWFYRINGGLIKENGEIQDTPTNTSDGDLIRGSMQAAAAEWNKRYGDKIKLSPADVQAILWYAEKDIWFLAGAEDSGTIDFATAAQQNIENARNNPELFGDIDGTADYRAKVVAKFVNSAPSIGQGLQGFGTEEAANANRNFFVTQMAVPARIGLAATTRKQVQNRKLLNFDAHEWNRLAEHANGKPLDQQQTNDLYNLLQNGYSAQTKIDKEEAIKSLNDFVDQLSKQSLPEFAMSVIRAGMLSGIRTTGRNLSSNFAYAVLEEGRRGSAAPMDVILAAMSPSGERAVQGLSARGVSYALKKAFTDGFRQFYKTLIHGDPGAAYETFSPGYDPKVRSSIFTFGKTGASFLNATVGNFAKYVFRFQQAQDNVFRTYAYNRAMYELAWLSEKNGGRPLQDVLTNPTVEESDMAWRAAETAVFQADNAINTAYQRAKSKAPDPVKWLLDYELPFVKTGSNIFMETMNYSVFGLLWGGAKGATELGKAVKSGGWQAAQQKMWEAIDTPEIRRTIIDCFSKGLVGTGIATIGFWLASKGLLYGMGGDEDERERNKRIAQGAGPGHLKVAGDWYDLRGISPVGTILISGASYWHALNKEMKSDDPLRRMDEVMKTVSALVVDGLPLARAVSDYTNPRSGSSIAQRALGADRVVPAIVGDVASIQDDVQREAKGDTFGENVKASIQKKIPNTPVTRKFNRQGLPAKTDIFNRAVDQTNPFNPLASKSDKENDVVREAKEVGWSFSTPKIDSKNKETRADYQERKAKTQQLIGRVFDSVIHDKEYPKELPKEERKKLLEESAGVARRAVKRAEPITDDEMKEIVESLIGSAKEKADVSKDTDLNDKEKKEERKKVASVYSKAINKVLGIEEE